MSALKLERECEHINGWMPWGWIADMSYNEGRSTSSREN